MDTQLSERQTSILNKVRSTGFVGVDELAKAYELTTQTIRRDINVLCQLGLLRRVHGGAEEAVLQNNISYAARRILNPQAKHLIAQKVAHLTPEGASLAFSIGTTPEIVAKALINHRNLRFFTNNMNVAMAALRNPLSEVTIAGGRLRHGDADILGTKAEDFFNGYKFDIGIIGVAGIDSDGTLLDFHEDEVAARQAIVKNCRQSILVVDQSKFGRQAHVRGGYLNEVTTIVCDCKPNGRFGKLLNELSNQVIYCS